MKEYFTYYLGYTSHHSCTCFCTQFSRHFFSEQKKCPCALCRSKNKEVIAREYRIFIIGIAVFQLHFNRINSEQHGFKQAQILRGTGGFSNAYFGFKYLTEQIIREYILDEPIGSVATNTRIDCIIYTENQITFQFVMPVP